MSGCPTLADNPVGLKDNVGVALTDSAGTTAVGESLMLLDSGAHVTSTMDAFAALTSGCASFTGTIDAGGASYTVDFTTTAGSFASIGDRTVAVELNANLEGFTFTTDIVFVQYKDTIIAVTNEGDPTDSSLTATAVDAAYHKAAARW